MTTQRIYALGPDGTFSGQAARRLGQHVRRGGEPEPLTVFTRTIPEVFRKVSADPGSRGVVPIENSYAGTVIAAQDSFLEHDVRIEWEILVPVRFRLLATAPLDQVRKLYTQPVTYEQCSAFLNRHLPDADVIFTESNTDSGERLRHAEATEPRAAIVPLDYGDDLLSLVAATDIQNDPKNATRFLVIRRSDEAPAPDFSRAKVSLVVDPQVDRPGLLHDILGAFRRYDINLCRIESRPQRTRPWAYVFYLDLSQHEGIAQAFRTIQSEGWDIRVLGTFDVLP